MFKYDKKLPYPINIKKKDLKMAKYIVTQFGGANGELGAALRYFSQKFSMPTEEGKNLLNTIATEEFSHNEMICTMLYQLTKDASLKEMQEAGLDITAEAENTECELIGASEGESYMISDSLIQVYKFDSTKSDELTVSNLKKAKEEGKVVMPSFNNYELKVVYHKGLILVNVEDHPDKDKIIEVFNNL